MDNRDIKTLIKCRLNVWLQNSSLSFRFEFYFFLSNDMTGNLLENEKL